jgi:hypothetical protein
MRALEIIVAVIAAAILFIAMKLIGLVLHLALIVAAIGFIAGFFITRAVRR